MSSFLHNIADYLEDNSIGTVGTDIFVGELPPDPDNCVALIGVPSYNPQPSKYIRALQFPNFQVLVRNTDYDAADTKMRAVRALLHVQIGLQLANYYVLQMHAYSEGGSIGNDDKNRREFTMNLYAEVREQDAPTP